MKSPVSALLLCCAMGLAHAAPGDGTYQDMDTLLASKGVLGQIGGQLQQAGAKVGEKTSDLLIHAMGFLGMPYKYGGNGAESGGIDCSGFVRAVYEQSVGKLLPRRASEQAATTQSVDRGDLQPGDLVFFNTMKRAFSHVGIYVGEGKFIHAPRTGSVVRMESMDQSYWRKRFDGARRVLAPGVMDTASITPAKD